MSSNRNEQRFLTQLLLNESAVEIYQNMCHAEKTLDYNLTGSQLPKYLKHRHLLVDWMYEVGEKLHLTTQTIHAAVHYMDRYLCITEVSTRQLQLIAITTILISAKFEELDNKVPPIDVLVKCIRHAFTVENIKQMEVAILNQLGWNIQPSCALQFLNYYIANGIVYEGDVYDGHPANPRVAHYVVKYAHFFADLCLQEQLTLELEPSRIASACVAAARMVLGVSPVWSVALECVTRYSEQDLEESWSRIHKVYTTNFPKHQPLDRSPAVITQSESG